MIQRTRYALVTPTHALLLAGLVLGSPTAKSGEVRYERDVRPILASHCLACHGPDAAAREADLRLDVRELAVPNAITPGKADESELIARITSEDPDVRMPPPDAQQPPLTADEIEILRAWIGKGADYAQHWAFVPPRRQPLPAVSDPKWPANPIDHFVHAGWDAAGLRPAPEADARTLVRRLSFDLVGLPPSSDQVAQYVRDPSPAGFARVVNRLLESAAYGERMTAYWLDVVRYADSVGIHGDQQWSMSPYRDWVIGAFNNNLPYDRFLTHQLAGDLLPAASLDQRVASAFNRLNMITAEGGAQPKEYLAKYAADRVRNTSAAMLGVTIGCAECHDHKFDPFTTREFYEFAALFSDLRERGVYGGSTWEPKMPVPEPQQQARLEALDDTVAGAERRLAAAPPQLVARFGEWVAKARVSVGEKPAATDDESEPIAAAEGLPEAVSEVLVRTVDVDLDQLGEADRKVLLDHYRSFAPELEEARGQLARATQERNELRKSLRTVVVSMHVEPRTMRVLPRGNWLDDSGEIVAPGVPQFLLPLEFVGETASRLDLARWMTDPQHPLTARVFVNRLWKLLFGRGLVTSLDDFGTQGSLPSHPELLDWLAIEFIESGWDVQHMLRLMVTSRTYRLASTVSPELREQDPENRWLARQGRFRLDAEMVRDNALQVSGLLVQRVGGRSVRPYQPAGYYAHLNFPAREYQQDEGDNLWRRTVYTHWQRTFLHPSLRAFDAPSREECTCERPRSNTPLQSLVLLNDPIYVEAGRALAAQVLADGPQDLPGRLQLLFDRALQRSPSPHEQITLARLLGKHEARFETDPKAADALLGIGAAPRPDDLDSAELAAWTSLARVVLNLHETITRH
ncbi:PSD1 and planctomycete cytochrome C domain-containing protein [Pirellulales bacterium]|nr:PSD1 and planctomycete cytochrome C domain-containing protein [Pirellulales bacterium]